MDDEEKFAQRTFDTTHSSGTSLHLDVIMGSNQYTTPPWTTESTMSDMTVFGMHDILQTPVGSTDYFSLAVSPVDELSASLLIASAFRKRF